MLTALLSTLTRSGRALLRRPAASVWAVLAVAAALVGVAATDLAARRVDAWSRDLRSQASMVIYLDEGATAERAGAIAERLGRVDGVEGAVVVGVREAEDRLRAALGAHDELLAGVDPTTLPISIEVTLAPGMADVIAGSPLVAELRAAGGVDDVEVTRDYTAPLGEALARLQRLAWVLLLVIGGGAAVLVSAAVRLRLAESTGEAAALAWLGASPGFVRAPAVVAGAVLGATGALLALAAAAALVHLFRIDVAPALGGTAEIVAWPLARAAALVGAGALLGLVGGVLASGRDAVA